MDFKITKKQLEVIECLLNVLDSPGNCFTRYDTAHYGFIISYSIIKKLIEKGIIKRVHRNYNCYDKIVYKFEPNFLSSF